MSLLLLSLLVCTPALAESAPDTAPYTYQTASGSYLLINNVALNASDADLRTVIIATNKRVSTLQVTVLFTHADASNVIAQMSCAEDGANYAIRQTRKCDEGDCTLYDLRDIKPTAGSKNFLLEYGVRSCERVKIVFSGTSAGASDKIRVRATGLAGA